jgi:hypothetical protein
MLSLIFKKSLQLMFACTGDFMVRAGINIIGNRVIGVIAGIFLLEHKWQNVTM